MLNWPSWWIGIPTYCSRITSSMEWFWMEEKLERLGCVFWFLNLNLVCCVWFWTGPTVSRHLYDRLHSARIFFGSFHKSEWMTVVEWQRQIQQTTRSGTWKKEGRPVAMFSPLKVFDNRTQQRIVPYQHCNYHQLNDMRPRAQRGFPFQFFIFYSIHHRQDTTLEGGYLDSGVLKCALMRAKARYLLWKRVEGFAFLNCQGGFWITSNLLGSTMATFSTSR